jgi:hypothetical protein
MEMETGFGSSNQYELASELSKKMWDFNLLFVSQMDPFRKEDHKWIRQEKKTASTIRRLEMLVPARLDRRPSVLAHFPAPRFLCLLVSRAYTRPALPGYLPHRLTAREDRLPARRRSSTAANDRGK